MSRDTVARHTGGMGCLGNKQDRYRTCDQYRTATTLGLATNRELATNSRLAFASLRW